MQQTLFGTFQCPNRLAAGSCFRSVPHALSVRQRGRAGIRIRAAEQVRFLPRSRPSSAATSHNATAPYILVMMHCLNLMCFVRRCSKGCCTA